MQGLPPDVANLSGKAARTDPVMTRGRAREQQRQETMDRGWQSFKDWRSGQGNPSPYGTYGKDRYRPRPVEVGPEREYTLHRSNWPKTYTDPIYDVSGYTIHDNMNLLNTHARAWNHPSQQPLDYVFTPQSFWWGGQQTYANDPVDYTDWELQSTLHHFQTLPDELPDWEPEQPSQ